MELELDMDEHSKEYTSRPWRLTIPEKTWHWARKIKWDRMINEYQGISHNKWMERQKQEWGELHAGEILLKRGFFTPDTGRP